jgi:CheY-like chemotaxis protein
MKGGHMNNSVDAKMFASPGNRKRILFVDDEELFGSMGSRFLERQGYQVTYTPDSQAALKQFAYQPSDYDLVITGQTLAGMTGTELSGELLKIRPDIPIVLCTADENLTGEEARRRGIREFIAKPVDSEIFATKIRNILG